MRKVVEGKIPRATWDKLGVVAKDQDAARDHIEKILALPFLNVDGIRKRGFKVGLDCVRGAGGVFMPVLLELLGCKLATINMEPDGRFPRPPEPTPENLGELQKLVEDSHCDIGMAVDPDVDRLALVSEEGLAIGEDYTLALAAKVVLRHRKGVVVTNLSTSRIIDDIAHEAGSRVIRAPVGEVNVATRMRAEGAPIGGEGNGSSFWKRANPSLRSSRRTRDTLSLRTSWRVLLRPSTRCTKRSSGPSPTPRLIPRTA
jgi:phosphomannomutase